MQRRQWLMRIAPTSTAAQAAMVRLAQAAARPSVCADIMLLASTEAHVWVKDTGRQLYLGEELCLALLIYFTLTGPGTLQAALRKRSLLRRRSILRA